VYKYLDQWRIILQIVVVYSSGGLNKLNIWRDRMKIIPIAIALLLTMSIPMASASIVNDLDLKVNDYNQNSGNVHSYVKKILGDEVIKLTITTNSGTKKYVKAVTKDAYVIEFEEVEKDTEFDTTMRVSASEATIESILVSDDPLETALEAKDDGKIIVKPIGIVNTVTYTVANGALKASQLIGIV